MNRPVTRDGMMLAASPPVGDDAVDLVAGRELLAEQPEGHLGDDHGVTGVDPLPRAAEAWAVRPVKVTSKWWTARQVASSRSVATGGPSSPRGRRRRRPARA